MVKTITFRSLEEIKNSNAISFLQIASSELQNKWSFWSSKLLKKEQKKKIQKFSMSAGGLSLLCWINFLQVANDA